MKRYLFFFLVLSLFSCEQNALNLNNLSAEIQKNFPSVAHISIGELNSRDLSNILLVDVREREEYAVSHIPGAKNITNAKDIAILALQSKKDIIVYCSVGYRSAIIAKKLKTLGVNNVTNLEGSIFAWANAELPLVNQTGNTRTVHPYNDYWGQLLDETVPIH